MASALTGAMASALTGAGLTLAGAGLTLAGADRRRSAQIGAGPWPLRRESAGS